MDKQEAVTLLKQITSLYPNVKLTKDAGEIWIDCLADVSYDRAKRNLLEHAKTSKFPPTIADIRGQAGKRQPEEVCSVTGRPYEFFTREMN